MKSFSQFLQESYLNEEEAEQLRLLKRNNSAYDFRKNIGNRGIAADPTPTPASRRLPPGAPEAPKTSSGQLEIPEPKTTKVSGASVRSSGEMRQPSLLTKSGGAQNFTKAGKGQVPFTSSEPVKATKRLPEAPPEPPKTSPGQQVIRQTSNPPTTKALPPSPKGGNLTVKPPTGLSTKPIQQIKTDLNVPTPKGLGGSKKQLALPSAGQTSLPKPSAGKAPEVPKVSGKLGKFVKALGPVATAVDTALSTADERAKGSGWARSLAKGATVAAGGLLGGTAGAIGGGGLLSAATGTAGAMAGGAAAEKAFDVAAGANAKERKAMATANRQRQAGSSLKGIGGPTSFDTKKNTMTTGTGAQRKTVALAKTGVVQRGGQSVAGHLAYKDGKAVYKAGPSAQSLAKTSSNPLERIGRSLFAGAYKKSDAANAAKNLAKARQSDIARNKALGVKFGPGK
jgi:hypothetical protein